MAIPCSAATGKATDTSSSNNGMNRQNLFDINETSTRVIYEYVEMSGGLNCIKSVYTKRILYTLQK